MKKILTVFVSLLALGALFVFVPSPVANAAAGDRVIYHDNDAGYDPPFLIRCTGAPTNDYVYEDSSGLSNGSNIICGVGYGTDVDRVYVRPGEQYYCKRNGVWQDTWPPSSGWHDVSYTFTNLHCVLHAA